MGRQSNNGKVFPKSANQPNEIALTICNSISRNCFRLMKDWKLERLANGQEISVVPFRTEKEDYLWRKSTISEPIFGKITVPFDFQPKFPDLFAKWQAPYIATYFRLITASINQVPYIHTRRENFEYATIIADFWITV